MQEEKRIYFQKQQQDSLCGIHSLNALLQGYFILLGPFISIDKLSQIAIDLDKKQNILLGGKKNKSQNVDVDGNFSIQVLQIALQQLGLHLQPLPIKEITNGKIDFKNENGLICNLFSHWFAIRKVNKEWYNLNSLDIPKKISSFYLQAFLQNINDQGYQIFIVRGIYPKPNNKKQNPYQHYYSISQLQALKLDKQLNQTYYQKQKQKKIISSNRSNFQLFYEHHHPNILYQIKNQLQQEFKIHYKAQEGIFIQFQFPNAIATYTFKQNQLIQQLYRFCFAYAQKEFHLQLQVPKMKLLDVNKTLKMQGITEPKLINVIYLNL